MKSKWKLLILPNQLGGMDNGVHNRSTDHGTVLLVNGEGNRLARLGLVVGPAAVYQVLQVDSARLAHRLLHRRLHDDLQYGGHESDDFVYLHGERTMYRFVYTAVG